MCNCGLKGGRVREVRGVSQGVKVCNCGVNVCNCGLKERKWNGVEVKWREVKWSGSGMERRSGVEWKWNGEK